MAIFFGCLLSLRDHVCIRNPGVGKDLQSSKISSYYRGLESVVNLRLDTISWCGILVISRVIFFVQSEPRVFTRLAFNCSFLRDLDALAPVGA